MPIIFITGHGDIPISVAAMKAGAVEFLTKPFNDEVLLTATRQAFRAKRGSSCSGGGDTGAQGSLGIAESTVKAHRGQVMQKMKANSVADLVKMIVKLHQSTATNHRMSSG